MQNHYNLVYREEEREMFPTLKACLLPIARPCYSVFPPYSTSVSVRFRGPPSPEDSSPDHLTRMQLQHGQRQTRSYQSTICHLEELESSPSRSVPPFTYSLLSISISSNAAVIQIGRPRMAINRQRVTRKSSRD